MTQNRVTEKINLLKDDGTITEEGYATSLMWRYDKSEIKAPWYRIKEWDYYAVLNEDFGLSLTIADLGYFAFTGIAWLDFREKEVSQHDSLKLFPRGKLNFPSSSEEGNLMYKDKKVTLSFEVRDNQRILLVDCPGFEHNGGKGLKGRLVLDQDPATDSMVIATSWKENRKKFYYNQKVNNMPAEGKVTVGEKEYSFTKENSFAVLDWGRGNWTYRNRWYWGSASGMHKGEPLGWNLGYGFSDRSSATENMVFYKGKAHKLEDIQFEFDPNDYMKAWKITSSDGRFEMDFEPAIDRYASTNLLLIKSIAHQVFGYYSGKIILDDGSELVVERQLGFAEDVLNWW